MKTLEDLEKLYKLSGKKFWKRIDEEFTYADKSYKELYARVENQILPPDESADCLFSMFVLTHARIRNYNKKLAELFPTVQSSGSLMGVSTGLWWLDHYTCGINHWNTLTWFSAARSADGKLHGASTHFVIGRHDEPFLIIPPTLRAWHEPVRNADSIAVEMSNPGALTRKPIPSTPEQGWYYRAGSQWVRLPQELISELPPVGINPPYRGAENLLPFTLDQFIHNIKIKRLVAGALRGKLAPGRMSQHSAWRETKGDMGPLWPFEEINQIVWDNIPIQEQDFITRYGDALDDSKPFLMEEEHDEHNEEYGKNTPTHDDDSHAPLISIKDVQIALGNLGFSLTPDGKFGPRTQEAVRSFQQKWNFGHMDAALKEDGIPGPETCRKLAQVMESGY